MKIRHYLDGEPYYCVTCGLGYGEYEACEEVDCKLEDKSVARKRMYKAVGGEKNKKFKGKK